VLLVVSLSLFVVSEIVPAILFVLSIVILIAILQNLNVYFVEDVILVMENVNRSGNGNESGNETETGRENESENENGNWNVIVTATLIDKTEIWNDLIGIERMNMSSIDADCVIETRRCPTYRVVFLVGDAVIPVLNWLSLSLIWNSPKECKNLSLKRRNRQEMILSLQQKQRKRKRKRKRKRIRIENELHEKPCCGFR